MSALSPELQHIFSSGEVLHPDTPDIVPLFQRHLASYQFCEQYTRGKDVLDVGTGEGYGTNIIAGTAKSVQGLELSRVLVEYAGQRYVRPNLKYNQGSATALPFEDGRFDVVTSLQLIEHFPGYMDYIREAYRVLRPGGAMVTVTPNPRMMLSGVNPYHYKEFEPHELEAAMKRVFPVVETLGLFGSARYMALKAAEQAFARKILRLDPLNLRSKLPRKLLMIPYRLAFLAVNRKTEQRKSATGQDITTGDFFVSRENLPEALESITVATKPS